MTRQNDVDDTGELRERFYLTTQTLALIRTFSSQVENDPRYWMIVYLLVPFILVWSLKTFLPLISSGVYNTLKSAGHYMSPMAKGNIRGEQTSLLTSPAEIGRAHV